MSVTHQSPYFHSSQASVAVYQEGVAETAASAQTSTLETQTLDSADVSGVFTTTYSFRDEQWIHF